MGATDITYEVINSDLWEWLSSIIKNKGIGILKLQFNAFYDVIRH